VCLWDRAEKIATAENAASVDGESIRVVSPVCLKSRQLVQLLPIPERFEGTRWIAYNSCWHNELVAMAERHMLPVETISRKDWGPERLERAKYWEDRCEMLLNKQFHYVPELLAWTDQQVLQYKTGKLRKTYERAFHRLLRDGLSEKDKRVSMFVKFEKMPEEQQDEKAPRAIQHYSEQETAYAARVLIPIEKWVFRNRGERQVFAKGMDSVRRAQRIVDMQLGEDWVWVMCDHSKFDAHISQRWLKLEQRFYSRFNPEAHDVVERQLVNVGWTACGLRFKALGRKMSGTYNTALGDTIVNYAIMLGWLNGRECEYLIDGDDSVLCMPRSVWEALDREYFSYMGFNTKVDYTDDLSQVEFCQSRPVRTARGWRMCRIPERHITRMAYTIRNYPDKVWKNYVSAIADGELVSNTGMPVLQEMALFMKRASGGARPMRLPQDETWRYVLEDAEARREPWPITEEARATFASAFGISNTEQQCLEEWYRGNPFRLPGATPEGRHA